MRKLITIILLLLSVTVSSQKRYYSTTDYGWQYLRIKIDSLFTLPSVVITADKGPGALRYSPTDSSLYVWSGFQWLKIQSGDIDYSPDSTIYATRNWTTTQYQPIDTYLKTGSNGLLSSGTNVKLGGSLSENTNIDPSTYTFSVGDGSNNKLQYSQSSTRRFWVQSQYGNGSGFSALGQDTGRTIIWASELTPGSSYKNAAFVVSPYGIIAETDNGFYLKRGGRYWYSTTNGGSAYNFTTIDTTDNKLLVFNTTTGLISRYAGAWPTTPNLSSYVTFSNLTDSLPNAVSSITLNTSGVLHTSPVTFTKTGRAWSGTLSLASQSAYSILRRGSGSGEPSFGKIDSNYFGGAGEWKTQVDAAANGNYNSLTALGSTGFTLNRPNGTKDTILFTGTSAGVQWTGSDSLFAYNRAKNGRHFAADFDWVSSGGQLYGSGDALMMIVSAANSGSFTSLNSSGVNGITLSTSSSSTAVTSLYYGAATTIRPFSFIGSDPFVYSWRIRINIAVDATDRYGVQVGFMSAIEGNITNGYYFSYDPYQYQTGSPATSNWATATASGGSRTWTSTSTAISPGTWVTLTVRATTTKVIFYVDGTPVAEHTGTITTTNTAPLIRLFKGQGTGARTVDVDYLTFDQWYSTAR